MSEPRLQQFEIINGRLIEARKALQERERVLSLMETLDRQLGEKREQLAQLLALAQAEKLDVADLEGWSITAVFNKLFSSYEEKLEREVQEYIQAKTDVEACQISINNLENNLQEQETFLTALADCDEAYEQAQAAQKAFLIAEGWLNPEQLAQLNEALAQQQSHLKGIHEALQVGQDALPELKELLHLFADGYSVNYLHKQRNDFSQTYTYKGMGRIVLRATHLQPKLDFFQAELKEIGLPLIPAPDLKTPSYNNIMYSEEGSLNNEASRLAIIPRWYNHLQTLSQQIEHKLVILDKKKTAVLYQIAQIQADEEALIQHHWQTDRFEG